MNRDLTKGNVTSSLLLFAGPMILGNLLQQCYNIVDTWVVGRYVGADAGESLSAYLTHYLQAAGSGALQEPSLPALIWSSLRWPALALLLGFTALGLLGLPILFAVLRFL